MAGHEQVIRAFFRVGIAHQATFASDRREFLEAAGDQLVRIDLMSGVPDQAVFREIEDQMQRDAELDDAQVAGEVSGAVRAHRTKCLADFGRQLAKLLVREVA